MPGLLSHVCLVWSQPFAQALMRAGRGELMALLCSGKGSLLAVLIFCLLRAFFHFYPEKADALCGQKTVGVRQEKLSSQSWKKPLFLTSGKKKKKRCQSEDSDQAWTVIFLWMYQNLISSCRSFGIDAGQQESVRHKPRIFVQMVLKISLFKKWQINKIIHFIGQIG